MDVFLGHILTGLQAFYFGGEGAVSKRVFPMNWEW